MGQRGPKPMSADALARRGSQLAKGRREQEKAAEWLTVVEPIPVSVDTYRLLTQHLVDAVNSFDEYPGDVGEKIELITSAAWWLCELARTPDAWR